jgi:hypothetical protein
LEMFSSFPVHQIDSRSFHAVALRSHGGLRSG